MSFEFEPPVEPAWQERAREWVRDHRDQLLGFTLAPVFVYAILAIAQLGDAQPACDWQFPKWFGCILSSYEGLAGGDIGAVAILTGAWIAWKAVQRQINADRERMLADRMEANKLLMEDLTTYAEGLVAAWRALVRLQEMPDDDPEKESTVERAREATAYMASWLSRPDAIEFYRSMIQAQAWDRQRVRCTRLIGRLHALQALSDAEGEWTLEEALDLIRDLADYFELCLPSETTSRLYGNLWRRSPKAMTFGMLVEHIAGLDRW